MIYQNAVKYVDNDESKEIPEEILTYHKTPLKK